MGPPPTWPWISRVFVQKVKLRVDRVLEAILHGRLPSEVKDKAHKSRGTWSWPMKMRCFPERLLVRGSTDFRHVLVRALLSLEVDVEGAEGQASPSASSPGGPREGSGANQHAAATQPGVIFRGRVAIVPEFGVQRRVERPDGPRWRTPPRCTPRTQDRPDPRRSQSRRPRRSRWSRTI